MKAIVPGARLLGVIEPVYPKAGNGRRLYALLVMLRINFMQQGFNYSDTATENALHDIPLLQRFSGLDAGTDTLPHETMIPNLVTCSKPTGSRPGCTPKSTAFWPRKICYSGKAPTTDATLIAVPPSIKSHDGQRDPEMRQMKKGNQRHFGMKAHIGVDTKCFGISVVHPFGATHAQ